MKNLHRSLRLLCVGAATILGGTGARAQITFPVNPFEAFNGNRAAQPAGEGVAEGRYLAMELEARLLSDPVIGGSQPSLELGANGWTLKGQFNNQAGRMRAREIVTETTGQAPVDKSRVVIYPTAAPKPLSPAAARVMAQRLIREKFAGLAQSMRCESESPGVIQVSGTALSVEDKLELIRTLHRQKGVTAVENEIVLGPMVRNGKRVILVSQNGDLALEKLPTSFRPGGDIEEQPAAPAPEKKVVPVSDDKVPPLPADFPPPPSAEVRGEKAEPVGITFIARGMPEDSPASQPVQQQVTNARKPSLAARPWRAPSSVQVGGTPIATLQDLNETTGTQWATAHAPTRQRADELAWQERARRGNKPQDDKVLAGAKAVPAATPQLTVAKTTIAPVPAATEPVAMTMVRPSKAAPVGPPAPSAPAMVTTVVPGASETMKAVVPVKATLKIDAEDTPAPLSGPKGKPSLAHLESAVRIACAGLVQKVEIVDQGGISLVRVTVTDVGNERKALEALVLLPEIHHPEVKLEVKLNR